jgi:serine phosphatase RsbU (regulator of sigma subunit)
VNPQTGEGSLVTAGCEPALLVRADGATEEMEVSGLPLGIERNELYTAHPFPASAR